MYPLLYSVIFCKSPYYSDFSWHLPVPLAARSKAKVCGCSPTEIVGSNPITGMDVRLLWVLCVVRGFCDKLITHPEESYRVWYVIVCDLETSWMRRPWPTGRLLCQIKKKLTSNSGTLTEENKVMWINHKKCIPLFIVLLPWIVKSVKHSKIKHICDFCNDEY
jgi:hypothetical protein